MVVRFISDKDGLIMTLHNIHHINIRKQSIICYVFKQETEHTVEYAIAAELDIGRVIYIGELFQGLRNTDISTRTNEEVEP